MGTFTLKHLLGQGSVLLKRYFIRSDCMYEEAKLLETILQAIFAGRKMELASNPSCFIFFGPL